MIKKIEENKIVLDFTNEGNNYLTNNSTSKSIAKVNITNDEITLNQVIPDSERRVQYNNMIYIGDGMTDIPCMKLVKSKNGKSIAIYQTSEKEKILPLVNDGRINYACPGDYRENSKLERIVKLILENMATSHKILKTEEKILNEYLNSVEKEQ